MSGIINPDNYYKNINDFQDVNEVFRCKSCGAPREPFSSQCKYCKNYAQNQNVINPSPGCSGLLIDLDLNFYGYGSGDYR